MAEERPRALAAHKPMAPITRSPTGLTSYRAQRIGRELAAYDLPLFNAARFRHNAPRRSADEKPGRRRAHRVTYLPASPEGNHTRRPIVRLDAKQRASRRLREARPAARLAWFRYRGAAGVLVSGPVTTSGLDAHAILAQSIGPTAARRKDKHKWRWCLRDLG